MPTKIAIVYAAHDGFTSLYTGVGTVARDFLLSFPEVEAQIRKFRPDVELDFYATTLKYNETCFGYSEEVKGKTLEMADKHKNIHLVELLNGSAAKESYGTIKNWQYACISTATFIYGLEQTHDQVIVITVDTPFVQVANYYLEAYDTNKVRFIWMPQSTVRIHRYGKSSDTNMQGNAYEEERFQWEKAVIDLANRDERVRIGCVGSFMRGHLIEDYGVNPAVLDDMTNSLYLPRLLGNVIGQEQIGEILSKIGVPLDRPLLFSFGRAEPYKGLDLVLKNVGQIIKEHNFFILIFASPYSMQDPYLKDLDALAEEYPGDIKIVYDLDFITPHYIMQWHNTQILAILSRAEPFGLIPIESRYYKNPNLTLLVSDRDGFKYQVADGVDGFMTPLEDGEIQAKLKRIATLTPEEKQTITTNGYNRVCKQHDQIKVDVRLLKNYLFDETVFSKSLREVSDVLNAKGITWCLGASGSLYVQGVKLKPSDLDIIVDLKDFDKAHEALTDLKPGDKEPFEYGGQTFYKFPLHETGFPSEIAGFDIASDRLEKKEWKGAHITVHPLDVEHGMYKQRPGKEDIVELIETAIKES